LAPFLSVFGCYWAPWLASGRSGMALAAASRQEPTKACSLCPLTYSHTLRPGRACISCNTFPALAHAENTSLVACGPPVAQLHRDCKEFRKAQSLRFRSTSSWPTVGLPAPRLLNAERAWNGLAGGTRGSSGGSAAQSSWRNTTSYATSAESPNMPVQPNLGPGSTAQASGRHRQWFLERERRFFLAFLPAGRVQDPDNGPSAIGMVPPILFSPRTRSATAPGAPQVSYGLGPPVSLLPSASKIETTRTRKTGIFELPTLVLGGEHT
jgi:hypothetical protein